MHLQSQKLFTGIRKWLLNKNTNFGSKYVITMTKYFYVTSDGYIFVKAFSCGCRNHLMMRMKKALGDVKPVHGLKAPQALTTMVGPKLNTKLYFSITYKQHIINKKSSV